MDVPAVLVPVSVVCDDLLEHHVPGRRLHQVPLPLPRLERLRRLLRKQLQDRFGRLQDKDNSDDWMVWLQSNHTIGNSKIFFFVKVELTVQWPSS